ncbi:YhaN family protein [Desulfonatronum sp. SC1]|uniref:ATP-binding protein n=1 Tax=Desulfonatronum sp. SC1 TaxID=2109626 RepID=UPI001304CD00|nr:YhaN family protein [Desulfonatronum sp. SC1]
MRIETLKLKAFGGFTDKELRFGGPEHRLHLVHGPNEAGKSTILRAITCLLFGFPHQSPDAHLHPNKNLCVGATLRLDNGEILDLTRFKRRKNDLLDAAGQAVDQSRLTRLLGGVSQDMFDRMFGLDQDKLRHGAEGLLRAEGNLGQALFAAASGIADLRGILAELEARRDKLFRPRAPTSAIHQQVGELSTLTKRLRELSVRPAQWKKLQSEFKKLQAEQRELQAELFGLDTTKARLERYREALRHIDPREALIRRLGEIADVPLLAEDFTERRTRVQQTLAKARHDGDALDFRLQQARRDLGERNVNRELLDAAGDVRRLYGETTALRKALKEARQLEADHAVLHAQTQEKIRSLGPEAASGERTAPISKQLKVRMDALGREHGALRANMASTFRIEQDAQAAVVDLRQRLENLPPRPDLFTLEAALDRAAEVGNPTKRLREARSEVEKLARRVDQEAKSLGPWQGSLADLEHLALPMPETLERFADQFQSLRERIETFQQDRSRREKTRREKASALERLELHGELPDPAALAQARTTRDFGWELIQNAWLQGVVDPDREAAFLDKIPSATSLAQGFETTMDMADDLADKLYANASGVAQSMELRRETTRLDEELRANAERLEDFRKNLAQLQDQWVDLWRPLNIAPLSPREMQAWSAKVLGLRRQLEELGERRAAHAAMEAEMHSVTARLVHALQHLGHPTPDETDYAAVLSKARHMLKDLQKQITDRAEMEDRLQELNGSLDTAARRREKAVLAMEAWTAQWAKTIRAAGLPEEIDPEAATALTLTLEEIAQAQIRLADIRQRIQNIRDDHRLFAEQVQALRHVAPLSPLSFLAGDESFATASPDDDQPSALEIIGLLHARLEQEQDRARRQKALRDEERRLEQELHDTTRTIQESEQELDALCAEAGITSPQDLQARESASRTKARMIDEERKIEERLSELAGGDPLDEFITAAREHGFDELSAELEGIRTRKEELGARRDACLAEIGRVGAELRGLDGSSQAADVHQQMCYVKARLQGDVQEYVRLRLASRVLSTEIERYREANQGPVLEAAARFFRNMTLGSFSGLLADYDEKGEPVVKAARASGSGEEQLLEMIQLSEGTRDQLFLALRLGALTRYLQTNPPLPLIADDILVNFDDQRCAATLNLLSDLAASTQVIFFTHHGHLVDIAQESLPKGRVAVHQLEG